MFLLHLQILNWVISICNIPNIHFSIDFYIFSADVDTLLSTLLKLESVPITADKIQGCEIDENECTANLCKNGGTCIDLPGDFRYVAMVTGVREL